MLCFPKDCYVIKRSVTRTLMTTCENKVLVFTRKEHANRYLRTYMQFYENKKDMQKLVVDQTVFDRLHKRCSLNSLNMCLVDENLGFSSVDPVKYDTDYVSFHLDNTIWYYSP